MAIFRYFLQLLLVLLVSTGGVLAQNELLSQHQQIMQ